MQSFTQAFLGFPSAPLFQGNFPSVCPMTRRKSSKPVGVAKPAHLPKFYGIRNGRSSNRGNSYSGVARSWGDCAALVNGVPGAKFKKFSTYEGALAFSKVEDSAKKNKGAKGAKGAKKKNFYAIRGGTGGFSGVVKTWLECSLYVKGVSGVKFKGFETLEEAEEFVADKEATTAQKSVEHGQESSLTKDVVAAGSASDFIEENNGVIEPVFEPEVRNSAVFEELQKRKQRKLVVYTDGACTNNGKRNSKGGYGVYFNKGSPLNISKPLEGHATSQRAEMTAMLEAIRCVINKNLLGNGGVLEIHTDSQYTKNGLDSWISGWQKNGWLTSQGKPVKNMDLWMAMYEEKAALLRKGIMLHLIWVKGHVGNPGNEAADRLAVAGIYGGISSTMGGMSEDSSNRMAVGISEGMLGSASKRVVGGEPEGMPAKRLEHMPGETPERKHSETSKQKPDGTSGQIYDGRLEQMFDGTTKQTPGGTWEPMPRVTSQNMPVGRPEPIPGGMSERMPGGNSGRLPVGNLERLPGNSSERLRGEPSEKWLGGKSRQTNAGALERMLSGEVGPPPGIAPVRELGRESQRLPGGALEQMLGGVSERLPDRALEEMPGEISKQLYSGESERVAGGVPEETPTGTPAGSSKQIEGGVSGDNVEVQDERLNDATTERLFIPF